MRILYVHGGSDLYGASRCLLRLAARLVRDGHAARVALSQDGPLREALAGAGVEVVVMDRLPMLSRARFKSLGGLLSQLAEFPPAERRLRQQIRAFQADLVHSNTATVLPYAALAARRERLPHVWHIREFFAEFGKIWPLYRRIILRCADRVPCVSGPVAAQFPEALIGSKVVVLHDGFPPEEFEPVPAERVDRFKETFGVWGHPVVGLVGRIKYQRKGQETLVRAAARLKPRFPHVRFMLIGSPYPGNEDHLDRLRGLIREVGVGDTVVYTGDAEDIKAAYAALDISVLASARPEPFGGVVVESMFMGKPVVGTNLGGTVEQIEDGVTGLLVPPGDPDALAEALARLLNDPEKAAEMGRRGREKALREFDFETMYERMMKLYGELYNQSAPPSISPV